MTSLELAWRCGLDASAMAEGAQAAPSGQPGLLLTRLMVSLRDLAPDNFPAPGFAPRIMAGAFLMKARGFVQPTGNAPEVRTILAPTLIAEAKALEDLLNTLRRLEARAWQGQFRDGED